MYPAERVHVPEEKTGFMGANFGDKQSGSQQSISAETFMASGTDIGSSVLQVHHCDEDRG